jgi:hypothetical protein
VRDKLPLPPPFVAAAKKRGMRIERMPRFVFVFVCRTLQLAAKFSC